MNKNQKETIKQLCSECKSFYGTETSNWLCSGCFKTKQKNAEANNSLPAAHLNATEIKTGN